MPRLPNPHVDAHLTLVIDEDAPGGPRAEGELPIDPGHLVYNDAEIAVFGGVLPQLQGHVRACDEWEHLPVQLDGTKITVEGFTPNQNRVADGGWFQRTVKINYRTAIAPPATEETAP